MKFVREHHVPSFLEYGEYPYVTGDEIKKALRLKAASPTCSTRCSNCAQNPAANDCRDLRESSSKETTSTRGSSSKDRVFGDRAGFADVRGRRGLV